ncbi:hypothetical protein N431DRAFT_329076, partial [Stipitochalara longipes BDJ]
HLILSLPRRGLIIYLNNYFTLVPLFTELRAYNFSIVSIIRLYKIFPKDLLKIKK